MIEKKITIEKKKAPAPISGFSGDNGRESYAVNQHSILKNGAPYFPVMGEMHYSRYPAQYWEESILKMKAGGVGILSSYVFWIHHEEEKGVFDWSGNKDLHRFLTLCAKHGMRVMLRIGPWAHGECRNGGFPDWLLSSGVRVRENDENYFAYVRRFYQEIYNQAKDFLFYREGTIIGVQIENEYGHCGGLQGPEGIRHIRTLKQIACDIGFRVPLYTSTGWGNGIVVEGETLPVLGGYAEAPWEQHTKERRAAPEYLFSPIKPDTSIGSDLAGTMHGKYSYDVRKYPYLTAELGGGLEPTHHRRPIVTGDDTGAMVLAFLGSGANLLGYYMYHGGTNPIGRFSTFQESRATGYLNDVPELSYDFQAPIGEYGFLSSAYGRLKALHLFLHDFGENMSASYCTLPQDNPLDPEDLKSLRYSVRYGPKGGFLFLSNYERRRRMTEKCGVSVEVETEDGPFRFSGIDLPDGKYTFYPFNIDLGGVRLRTATAQLLCHIGGEECDTCFFFCFKGDRPAFTFQSDGLKCVEAAGKNSPIGSSGTVTVSLKEPEFHSGITVKTTGGKTVRFVVLTRDEAYRAWKIPVGAKEYLLVTDAGLRWADGTLTAVSDGESVPVLAYPSVPFGAVRGASFRKTARDGCLEAGTLTFDPLKIHPSAEFRRVEPRNCDASYVISVCRSEGENTDDDILTVRFSGDRARLFIDGRFCADWFYFGPDWRIGLKRFGSLKGRDIRLDLTKLTEDAPVYLEKKPAFENGCACRLDSVSICPEYRCTIRLDAARA